MIINRRRVMGGKTSPYDVYGYIRKGKVFHLDGIDIGNVIGHWIEKMQGCDFTLSDGITQSEYGLLFENDATATMSGNPTWPSYDSVTVEICIKGSVSGTISERNILATNATTRGPWIRFNSSYSGSQGQKHYMFVGKHMLKRIQVPDIDGTTSISTSHGVQNGVEYELSSLTNGYGASSNCSVIGIPNYTVCYCSIRVYNRILTLEEVLTNQRIDNERFNLGLTI